MSDSSSLRDRYYALIDQIVDTTLQGKIRSKEQVYQRLVRDISTGTGEIFERCLAERLDSTQSVVSTQTDELKKAKANRILKALQTIQGEWERWQKENRVNDAIASSVQQILTAEPGDRLTVVLKVIDPNQQQPLTLSQLQQLAKALNQQLSQTAKPDEQDLQQLTSGILRGVESWQRLEPHLVSWMYDQGQAKLGFEGIPGQHGPWAQWAKQVNSPFPQALFHTLALNQSLVELAKRQAGLEVGALVELAVILQCLQRGLVAWFDKLVYDSKVGAKLSISTFLTFAVIWSQLANGFSVVSPPFDGGIGGGKAYANGCFQVTLQVLRAFSVREYFPLYGGIFASFTGDYLRDALNYFDEPLRRVEGTQEKARILTLFGYSLRAQGRYDASIAVHQEALEIARQAGDRPCEIANLNHLSRTSVAQKNYAEAINYSQRALILARSTGDAHGEANALASLGYSEVFQARGRSQMEPEVYESAINYLQQGLQLSERLGDRHSQALCLSSLGLAYLILEQPETALEHLASGYSAAQFSGDLYLQGLNMAYLAEAYYSIKDLNKALGAGCLGMYLLEQIAAREWRQPAGLVTILRGKMGAEAFQKSLEQQRSNIIPVIGVDGYDYIPQLLEKYQGSME